MSFASSLRSLSVQREFSVLNSIKDREISYLLSGARLRAKETIPKLDIGSVHLEGMNAGDSAELPRWIAEVFSDLGVCEIQEESFSSEVFRAVNREKIIGETQIAELRQDFYLKIRRHLAYSKVIINTKPAMISEIERTKTLIYDLVSLRLRKILLIASSPAPPGDMKEKLTPEEYQIFDSIYSLLQSWRNIVLEG
jgi:hypothetical protein